MVLRSATIGVLGNRLRRAFTPFIPSAIISGVPASSQSTPARSAISAVERASAISMTSNEICTIGFMAERIAKRRGMTSRSGEPSRTVRSTRPLVNQSPARLAGPTSQERRARYSDNYRSPNYRSPARIVQIGNIILANDLDFRRRLGTDTDRDLP